MQHALPYLAKAIAGASPIVCMRIVVLCPGYQQDTARLLLVMLSSLSLEKAASWTAPALADGAWRWAAAGTIVNRQNPEMHDVACEALRCDLDGLQEALLLHLHVRRRLHQWASQPLEAACSNACSTDGSALTHQPVIFGMSSLEHQCRMQPQAVRVYDKLHCD